LRRLSSRTYGTPAAYLRLPAVKNGWLSLSDAYGIGLAELSLSDAYGIGLAELEKLE
jgi:hypothetical protein